MILNELIISPESFEIMNKFLSENWSPEIFLTTLKPLEITFYPCLDILKQNPPQLVK